jgi:RNA polymerase sigma-70 factor (ECF subfamily)
MHPHLEDQALMQRIAQGDAAAFRILSQDHLQAIVTFAYRLLHNHAEAEDVAQETFLRAWTNAAKYKPEARVSTWLHTIARNLAIDRMRKRKTRGDNIEIDNERDAAPLSGRPSQLLIQKQQALTVQEALLTLPERQRSVVLLSPNDALTPVA